MAIGTLGQKIKRNRVKLSIRRIRGIYLSTFQRSPWNAVIALLFNTACLRVLKSGMYPPGDEHCLSCNVLRVVRDEKCNGSCAVFGHSKPSHWNLETIRFRSSAWCWALCYAEACCSWMYTTVNKAIVKSLLTSGWQWKRNARCTDVWKHKLKKRKSMWKIEGGLEVEPLLFGCRKINLRVKVCINKLVFTLNHSISGGATHAVP